MRLHLHKWQWSQFIDEPGGPCEWRCTKFACGKRKAKRRWRRLTNGQRTFPRIVRSPL